jgi:N4-(beta-N-acetylglucosaminyl)-L-asparaginase
MSSVDRKRRRRRSINIRIKAGPGSNGNSRPFSRQPERFARAMSIGRRDMLIAALLGSASGGVPPAIAAADPRAMPDGMNMDEPKPQRPATPRLPAILCRTADTIGIAAAYRALLQGADTLDAALRITTAQENNPNDTTTGIGGLPDAEGMVRLDAACFHGPSRRGAAIGGVGAIRNASLLARLVLEKTGYPLLCGDAAHRFGIAHGLPDEALETDRTQKTWALWKTVAALPKPLAPGGYDPNWIGPDRDTHFLPASQKQLDTLVNRVAVLASQAGLQPQWIWRAAFDVLFPSPRPLFVAAINGNHEMSCVATTSGEPWRMAGAVSDIAMLGAGSYLDPDIGSAGASGNADANIRISGARVVVENMGRGMSPLEAGMDALRRVAAWYRHDMRALRFVELAYYVLRRDGAYACVSLWQGDRTGFARRYTIHDGVLRSEECAYLFSGSALLQA